MEQNLLALLRQETLEALDQVFANLSMLSEIAKKSIHLFFHPNNRTAANRFLDIMEIDLMGIKTRLQLFDAPSEEEFKRMDCKAVGMRDVCNLILIYLRRFLTYCVQAKTLLNRMQEFNDPDWDDAKCDKLAQEKRLFAIVLDNLSNLCTLATNSKRISTAVAEALNADLTRYPRLPIVSLTMIHLMLSSTNASTFEAALKVLDRIEFINVIDENQYPIFKEARTFIKGLITCDETFFKFLYIYKLFDVSKDQASKELLESEITNDEKSNLRKELLALLKEDVYLIPNTKVWAGYTFCDGSFSIAIRFLNSPNQEDTKIRIAQTLLIILHELSHKKRLKHQAQGKYFKESTPEDYKGIPGYKEAGSCLEKKIFGTVIGSKLLNITLPMANKLLDKNCWKNASILDDVFKKLDIPSKSGSSLTYDISSFDDCRCGKEDFNKALQAETDADEYMRAEGINID